MERGGPLSKPNFKPLLVGINWPSIDLLFPWERPPQIQSANPQQLDAQDYVASNEEAEVQLVARLLPADQRAMFYKISGSRSPMTEMQADALAGLLLPLYTAEADSMEPAETPSEKSDLIHFWRTVVGPAKEADALASGAAAPLGLLDLLPDPRDAIRVFSVWKMKDRAGKVGASGVRDMLRVLLSATQAKCHLIGHSFGCKVVLSAAGYGEPLPRPVTSALLLQPAINGFCFSKNADGNGLAGGYRMVLERIQQPILSTFSSHDMPLTKFFHLALWRKSDLGEIKIARAGEPPSRYAALGGFGPQGCSPAEAHVIDIMKSGQAYKLSGPDAPRIFGLRSDSAIDGHGGVVNPATAWALYCQVTA